MWVSELLRLVVLGYITKSMVLVSPSVKICDFFSFLFFFFFFTAGVSDVSEKREKKKKKDTRQTPESGESYPFWCPTPKMASSCNLGEKGGGCIFNELHGTCSLQMSRAGCHCVISCSHTIFTIQLHHHNLNQDSTISSS